MKTTAHLQLLAGGLLLALATLPPAAGAAPVERLDIIDRAIAFHGGDLYRASETELDVCSKSGCFHVRALIDGDAFEYEVSGRVRGRERRVRWTPKALELTVDGEPTAIAAGDEQALRDWVNARVYFCFLPYRLNDPSVFKEDLGVEEWDGRPLAKVKVTFTPGSSTDADDEYLYWLDPETARVELFAYSFDNGLRFRRAKNHRRIGDPRTGDPRTGGLLFFDQENLGVDAKGLSVEMITPEYVEEKMRLISTVRLESIEVRPLR